MKNSSATKSSGIFFALAFGLFLGLCIWKFGNPVILEKQIGSPTNVAEFWGNAWPPRWANWILVLLTSLGGLLIFKNHHRRHSDKSAIGNRQSKIKWLWLLPLAWLGWQFVSATQTVDAGLTRATLWQFSGCVACYFLGVFLFGAPSTSSASSTTKSIRAEPVLGAPKLGALTLLLARMGLVAEPAEAVLGAPKINAPRK